MEATSVLARWPGLVVPVHPDAQGSRGARRPGCFWRKINEKPLSISTPNAL